MSVKIVKSRQMVGKSSEVVLWQKVQCKPTVVGMFVRVLFINSSFFTDKLLHASVFYPCNLIFKL